MSELLALPVLMTAKVIVDAAVIDAARRAMSPNSWRALRADARVFADWCAARSLPTLPALPTTVAAFLRDQAEHGKKAATLGRYGSSIARLHALADQPDPTKAELVRLELKAQRRALGVRQRQARGLRFKGEVADPLAAAGPIGVCVEAMLQAAPDSLQGSRDRALLSLAFDTGLRRSELVSIRCGHLERGSAGGGRLFVPRSKTDQDAAGAYAYLSPRTMAALSAWRDAGAVREGAVFRRLHRTRDRAGEDVWTVGAGLSAQSVTSIYRALLDAARDAGLLDSLTEREFEAWRAGLTAHSTRVGLTQDLFASGQDLAGIMQALRWKSPAQPARYAQALAVDANAAAKIVGRL
jgi:integrase